MALVFPLLSIFFLFNLVTAELVLEDGYVVTTVIDGHRLLINPRTVHARSGSSDLIILDSSASSFYSASLPLSEESEVKRFAGDGTPGYYDGELGRARFRGPRSFAIDAKGSVYVADKSNKAIRKISHSGTVTTIAGGISNTSGHRDGPAQNASFSNDFELTFVPQGCYLLVSDHGNQLIRQIDLKEEDCVRSSHSTLGTVSVWAIGLLLSCLLGIVIGIVVRPYVIPLEGSNLLLFIETWKLHLINLGKQAQILFSVIRSGAAKVDAYSIIRMLFQLITSHLSLMFSLCNVNYMVPLKKTVSLLAFDNPTGSQMMVSEKISNDLMDLISFEDNPGLSSSVRNEETNKEAETVDQDKNEVLSNQEERINRMIQTHINGFGKVAEEDTLKVGSSIGGSVLVKRR